MGSFKTVALKEEYTKTSTITTGSVSSGVPKDAIVTVPSDSGLTYTVQKGDSGKYEVWSYDESSGTKRTTYDNEYDAREAAYKEAGKADEFYDAEAERVLKEKGITDPAEKEYYKKVLLSDTSLLRDEVVETAEATKRDAKITTEKSKIEEGKYDIKADGKWIGVVDASSEAEALAQYADSLTDPEAKAKLYEQAANKESDPIMEAEYMRRAKEEYQKAGNEAKYTELILQDFSSNKNARLSSSEKTDIENRIKELEGKSELTNEEQKELNALSRISRLDYIREPTPLDNIDGSLRNFFYGSEDGGFDLRYLNAYPGITTALYDEDLDLYSKIDERWRNIIFEGPDGWATELCKESVVDDVNPGSDGFAFGSTSQSASVFIQGEKIPYQRYDSETEEMSGSTIYKVSFGVNPGSESQGCDIGFTVEFGDGTPIITEEDSSDAYEFHASRGSGSIRYGGSASESGGNEIIVVESSRNYDEVCININNLEGRQSNSDCLLGVDEGDEVCSELVIGEEQQFTDFGCSNCDTFGLFGIGGGGTREPSERIITRDTEDGSGDTTEDSTSSPIVNPDI